MAKQRRSFRGQLTIANAVTTLGMLTALAGLLEATRSGMPMPAGRLRLVVALIATAAVLDALDGPLARARHTAGPFGAELDSLADMAAFGVTPAIALYFAELHRLPVAGLAGSAVFAVCAAWRLARFRLCHRPNSFVGCPVPLAAVLAGLAAVLGAGPAGTLATVLVLGALMVGTLPFPTWAGVLAVRFRPGLLRAVPPSSAGQHGPVPAAAGAAAREGRR